MIFTWSCSQQNVSVQIVFKDSRQDRGQIRITQNQVKIFMEITLVCILKCPEFVKLCPQMNIKFKMAKILPHMPTKGGSTFGCLAIFIYSPPERGKEMYTPLVSKPLANVRR